MTGLITVAAITAGQTPGQIMSSHYSSPAIIPPLTTNNIISVFTNFCSTLGDGHERTSKRLQILSPVNLNWPYNIERQKNAL